MIYRDINEYEFYQLSSDEELDNLHIAFDDGEEWWYSKNTWHRADGPAITYRGYYPHAGRWYFRGKQYFNNKSFQEVANLSDEEMTVMILKYGNIS